MKKKIISEGLTLRECIYLLYQKDIHREDVYLCDLQCNMGDSSLVTVETPDPSWLDIQNRVEIIRKLLSGEGVTMELVDDIETSQEEFEELVAEGKITVESDHPETIEADGLDLSVNKE